MEEQVEQLNGLVGLLPCMNLVKSYSQLNTVLTKYTAILDYVNGYNDELKRATSMYYSDITDIRDNIQHSLYSETIHEKDRAFESAKKQLKTDIQSLATLVEPKKMINTPVVADLQSIA